MCRLHSEHFWIRSNKRYRFSAIVPKLRSCNSVSVKQSLRWLLSMRFFDLLSGRVIGTSSLETSANVRNKLARSHVWKNDIYPLCSSKGFEQMRPVLNLAGFTYSYLRDSDVTFSRSPKGWAAICPACLSTN